MDSIIYPNEQSVRPSIAVNAVDTDINNSMGDVILLGMADDGIPGKVYTITSWEQGKSIFGSGDLVDALELVFDPYMDVSPSEVLAERVGQAGQSSMVSGGLKVVSNSYSNQANNILFRINKDPTTGNYFVLVNNNGNVTRYNNLGNIFKIGYTGPYKYAHAKIDADSESSSYGLSIYEGNTENSASLVAYFNFNDSQYYRLSNIISYINYMQGFSASYYPGTQKNIETKYLDVVPDMDLQSGQYFTALGGDIYNSLSESDDVVVTFDLSKGEPKAGDYMLAGGYASQEVPGDWSGYFNNLIDCGGYYLVPLTSDVTIQAQALQFCIENESYYYPMTMIVGGDYESNYGYHISRAKSLTDSNIKVVVVGASGRRLMADGRIYHLPGYMLAAQIAGLASALPIGESIGLHRINLISADTDYSKEDRDLLSLNGVITVEAVQTDGPYPYRITDDVTVLAAVTDDPSRMYLSTGEESDYLVRELATDLANRYIGNSTTSKSPSDIKAFLTSTLMQMINDKTILDYDQTTLSVVVNGNTVYINIDIYISQSTRKINIGLNYNLEATGD